jgi:hypothetical protein
VRQGNERRDATLPDWRRLEAAGLPVGALQVLEVVGVGRVVDVDLLRIDHQRVADEEVRHVPGQQRRDAYA